MASSLNGTGLTFSSGATLNSPPVTSIATGNGLQGGTITSTGTLSVACPTFNTVGSYVFGYVSSGTQTAGSNYSAGGAANQVQSCALEINCGAASVAYINNLSGTWKRMGASTTSTGLPQVTLFCRVA